MCHPVCSLSLALLYKPVDRVTRSTLVLHVSDFIFKDKLNLLYNFTPMNIPGHTSDFWLETLCNLRMTYGFGQVFMLKRF